jgi:hypothetical protein
MTFILRYLKLGSAGRREAYWAPRQQRLWLLIALMAALWLGLSPIPLKAAEDANLFN